ncbi:MAG: hypothetical protein JXA82_14805 [Sedimentisphaerales bacterium]|nr:hypothetical protein [Sedimentisphaerales bacterium]
MRFTLTHHRLSLSVLRLDNIDFLIVIRFMTKITLGSTPETYFGGIAMIGR